MMSYLYTKFHDNWISIYRGVAMSRFWDCTPRPAFAFGDAGKKLLTGHESAQSDGQTNGQTDRRTNKVISIYPLNFVRGGSKNHFYAWGKILWGIYKD